MKEKLIYTDLELNIKATKEIFNNSDDLIERTIKVSSISITIFYITGLVDTETVNQFILKSSIDKNSVELNLKNKSEIIGYFKEEIITVSEIKEIKKFKEVIKNLVNGNTVIFVGSSDIALAVDTVGWENRGVEEPTTQTLIRGPKDGFTENLNTNTSLLRRKIKNENLTIKEFLVGEDTQTKIAVAYVNDICDQEFVNKFIERVDKLKISGILESAHIEEIIEDPPYSPFPKIYNSERPDSIAAGLLEGRIAILTDGTPFALLAPALFVQFFQTSEDHYQKFDISSFIRVIRFLSFFFALLTPSLYIAITSFHQEMIPTPLLVSLISQREGVPFPAVVEALMMELTFEVLREAGVRMPRAAGSAISIVGALVLGQAAVDAGLISPAMVIVVSFTAISSFVAPSINMTNPIRLLRFIFMIIASILGIFGIVVGIIILILHLCSIRSFGIPYMYPFGPFNLKGQKDFLIRWPHKERRLFRNIVKPIK